MRRRIAFPITCPTGFFCSDKSAKGQTAASTVAAIT